MVRASRDNRRVWVSVWEWESNASFQVYVCTNATGK